VHKNSGGDSDNRLGVSRNERREIDVDPHDKRRHADLLQVLLYIYFNLEKSAITFPFDQSRDWCNIWRPLARSFNKLSIEFSRVNSM
jgi:hypothetical protein